MTKEHTSEEIKYRLSDLGVQIGNIAIEYITNLEKEIAELKSRDCWKACEFTDGKTELIHEILQQHYNLTKAKEIIKNLKALYFSPVVTKDDVKRQDEILNEAEQFISEVEI